MVLAVLEARCGLSLGDRDVYLNVAGGLRISEACALCGRDLAARDEPRRRGSDRGPEHDGQSERHAAR